MDMAMPYNPAVANLSLSDPNCINAGDECTAFYAAQNASQAAVSWVYQFEYGHWATYYYVIVIGLLFMASVFTMFKDHLTKGSANALPKPSPFRKIQALGRWAFYRQTRASWPTNLLDLPMDFGTIMFLFITMVFFTVLVFAVRPYYREQIGYGSPPIAIRSGLMAFACVPVLVALAGKVNVVTFFTGISHERLNVLHRWVAWISFVLSLIHAIPFFVGSARNPVVGGEYMVKTQFYMYGTSGANEYTGVPPLAILFGLCVLSLPYVRERFYESFYAAHIVLAITYFGLLFWHSANTMDSWAYLWATLAVWGASWLVRLFWKTRPLNIRNSWFSSDVGILRAMPGDVTRVDVWPSGELRWTPSQHMFLRFTDIAPMESHPFTIATAESGDGSPCHLVFLARAHTGLTRRLTSYAQVHALSEGKAIATSVWLDGPYGGLRRPLHTRYNTLILVAGGTGITACFPWLQESLSRVREYDIESKSKRVVLVWAIKSPRAVCWLADELEKLVEIKEGVKNPTLEIKIHVTGRYPETGATVPYSDKEGAKVDVASSMSHLTALGATVHSGRPIMPMVMQDFVRQGERSMVVGCGPRTFRADLGNAVAAAQMRVLKGDLVELAMHLEKFGW